MKKAIACLLLMSLVCGCGTLGTFEGIEKGKTSKTQVVGMLGSPERTQFIDSGEIWKYQFVRQDGKYQVVMDLGITFNGNMVENYQVRTSRSVVKKKVVKKSTVPAESSVVSTRNAPHFVTEFDRNKDGKVSSSEFMGNQHLFNKWDANGDGYVDVNEAASIPPKPTRQPRSR